MKNLLTAIARMLSLTRAFGPSQNSLTITPLTGDLYIMAFDFNGILRFFCYKSK